MEHNTGEHITFKPKRLTYTHLHLAINLLQFSTAHRVHVLSGKGSYRQADGKQ